MTTATRTQVAIIGGGPAGLLLSHMLGRNGIDCIVLERQSRAHVLERIRAGVLEAGSVELLREVGLGARMDREGHPHDGSAIAWEGRPRFLIDTAKFTGKPMMAYGQTAITEDLYAARDAAGGQIIDEADNVALHDLTSERPFVTYEKDGQTHRIDCDYVAGCDGYHGVSRQSIPASMLKTYEKGYPFGWLGIMSETPPYRTSCYCYHHAALRSPRCAIRCSAATTSSATSTRNSRTGRTTASGRSSRRGVRRRWRSDRHRPVDRKIDRAAAQLRRRADALRPAVPRRRCRPHRPADRREGPQSRGVGRLLSVARAGSRPTAPAHALPRLLFRHGVAPGVELGAGVVVADHAAPRFPDEPAFEEQMRGTSSIICTPPSTPRRRWPSNMPACRSRTDAVARP